MNMPLVRLALLVLYGAFFAVAQDGCQSKCVAEAQACANEGKNAANLPGLQACVRQKAAGECKACIAGLRGGDVMLLLRQSKESACIRQCSEEQDACVDIDGVDESNGPVLRHCIERRAVDDTDCAKCLTTLRVVGVGGVGGNNRPNNNDAEETVDRERDSGDQDEADSADERDGEKPVANDRRDKVADKICGEFTGKVQKGKKTIIKKVANACMCRFKCKELGNQTAYRFKEKTKLGRPRKRCHCISGEKRVKKSAKSGYLVGKIES